MNNIHNNDVDISQYILQDKTGFFSHMEYMEQLKYSACDMSE